MKTYLITGAAGFIGANFIKYMLAKYPEIKIVVLKVVRLNRTGVTKKGTPFA